MCSFAPNKAARSATEVRSGAFSASWEPTSEVSGNLVWDASSEPREPSVDDESEIVECRGRVNSVAFGANIDTGRIEVDDGLKAGFSGVQSPDSSLGGKVKGILDVALTLDLGRAIGVGSVIGEF